MGIDGSGVHLLWRAATGEERRRSLRAGDLMIGSAPDNDLVFPGPFVLRHHAVLRNMDGACTLVNLAGSGGTRVNGECPAPTGQPLHDGDVVVLGDMRLYFRREALPAPAARSVDPPPARPFGPPPASTAIYPASLEHLPRAHQALLAGESVLGPYDSTYLLYAHLQRPAAMDAIFRAKGRPADKPLTVIARPEDMPLLAHIPPQYRTLIDQWFPGPVTLIFPKRQEVPDPVTRGLPTVGLTYGRLCRVEHGRGSLRRPAAADPPRCRLGAGGGSVPRAGRSRGDGAGGGLRLPSPWSREARE
ncbi:MAG: Sua5/YciO/YrdC/YwlC family protein [Chloroflexi bacterium]|nr:Sua5/YciO/YrdC/YwlC family protein [Chloroflexota bacterium]